MAEHLVAGDIRLEHVNGNVFVIKLRLYKDCFQSPGGPPTTDFNPDPLQIGIFDKTSNSVLDTVFLTTEATDTLTYSRFRCKPPSNFCVSVRTFSGTVTLDPAFYNNPGGYYISWERCCRNLSLDNIQDIITETGHAFYMEFTPGFIQLQNSSPLLPAEQVFWTSVNAPYISDMMATDINNDSLVYSLETPLAGNTSSNNNNCVGVSCGLPIVLPGPYKAITWSAGLSNTNPLPGSPTLSINPQTGLLTATPTAQGRYAVVIKCEEFRNGVKLGEVRRETHLSVQNYPNNARPTITVTPTDTVALAGDDVCFNFTASDPDAGDSIFVTASSELIDLGHAQFSRVSGTGTLSGQLCVSKTCELPRENNYTITFTVHDNACALPDTSSSTVQLNFRDDFIKFITNLPNVFSPNDDGINDSFSAGDVTVQCARDFSVQIFNRWGQNLFKSNNIDFKWDGGKNPNGTYYYIILSEENIFTGSIMIMRPE